MVDARQLRYFVALVEELHFARAADRLKIAQSALSTQIQRLERDLGVRLLNRNKRQPVALTDAGKLFHAEAVAALRHIERADQIGRLAARGLAGIVRIGSVASGVTSGVLSGMLRDFRLSHPNVRIEVISMETPRQFEALGSGEIDVGIVRPRRQYPSGVVATRVQDFISGLSLASAGYGVSVVPESMRNIAQPGLCFRSITDFDFPVHLALASRRRELSPAVRAFVETAVRQSCSPTS
ncbi:LysR family transcriptional regulator [Paraburkholderia phytofirmans OLGA172]|uniref:LysR family transcriptional regulator n=1 Tax=Paraburkholderia phytofirmans OLGA172 TaxID=1417228 RepID=A0A161I7S4_9BURK|nr:LysR family transcriptional regulator [Paraburkholderia phytofirmans]ANB75603.1 LysR family transcriptional regulator [Paraburkholderia phytofirmans OLGA172]